MKMASISEGSDILATENQQAIINDLIEVKMGVNLHGRQSADCLPLAILPAFIKDMHIFLLIG